MYSQRSDNTTPAAFLLMNRERFRRQSAQTLPISNVRHTAEITRTTRYAGRIRPPRLGFERIDFQTNRFTSPVRAPDPPLYQHVVLPSFIAQTHQVPKNKSIAKMILPIELAFEASSQAQRLQNCLGLMNSYTQRVNSYKENTQNLLLTSEFTQLEMQSLKEEIASFENEVALTLNFIQTANLLLQAYQEKMISMLITLYYELKNALSLLEAQIAIEKSQLGEESQVETLLTLDDFITIESNLPLAFSSYNNYIQDRLNTLLDEMNEELDHAASKLFVLPSYELKFEKLLQELSEAISKAQNAMQDQTINTLMQSVLSQLQGLFSNALALLQRVRRSLALEELHSGATLPFDVLDIDSFNYQSIQLELAQRLSLIDDAIVQIYENANMTLDQRREALIELNIERNNLATKIYRGCLTL